MNLEHTQKCHFINSKHHSSVNKGDSGIKVNLRFTQVPFRSALAQNTDRPPPAPPLLVYCSGTVQLKRWPDHLHLLLLHHHLPPVCTAASLLQWHWSIGAVTCVATDRAPSPAPTSSPPPPPPAIVTCLDLFGVNFRLNYSSEIIRIARSLQTVDKSSEHGWRTRLAGSGLSQFL